ncbi:transcriptional regulator family: Histone-like TF [Penicillium pulvis]|uniref:transcriptional regulator family: Histone-like TF n=1 Tax=Penicillium pulvis TaxID=1562058 RepID=UPI0025498349|nr:transcriptional regulator family: Histone-like TF [Penicillium pulvis]KAJ5792241.1 transcriptional regulator family: Histone-like TF [Penicillium pulvis]
MLHNPRIHRKQCPRSFSCHYFLKCAMAATQKLYPRGTVKRIVKAHSNKSVSKNADILIFLDYMLFMQELMREASIRSRKSGEKNISANSIRKVTEKSLRKYQG